MNTVADAFGHPQATHNAMFVKTDTYTGAGVPAKLSRTPGSIRRPPQPFAADTDAVLDALGIDAAHRDALRQAGAPRHACGRHRKRVMTPSGSFSSLTGDDARRSCATTTAASRG